MILKEFPDITWLKKQIRENFAEQKSWENKPLLQGGWPTVVLNANEKQIYRPEVKGPFSVFMNLSGKSHLRVGNNEVDLFEHSYAITNNEDHYDLLIDNPVGTETFNIHFGESFVRQAHTALSQTEEELLTKPDDWLPCESLPLRSYFKDLFLRNNINHFKSVFEKEGSSIEKDEALFSLFQHLWEQNISEKIRVTNLSALKSSTREELINRLYLALEYIHAFYHGSLEIDTLSRIACMSKFHFLRTFKAYFGLSPYQYIKKLRLENAMILLKSCTKTVEEIAYSVGFENSSSLSRAVFLRYGIYPSALRA